MRQRMDKGPIPQDLVLKWMLQVSVALHYLHQQNLIHRDIKPDNIFIDENENAIVGDLGLVSNRFMADT
jgi:NIMA (never in mitosis gene a)-related kinase